MISDEELSDLRREMKHQQDKVDEYNILKDDLDRLQSKYCVQYFIVKPSSSTGYLLGFTGVVTVVHWLPA